MPLSSEEDEFLEVASAALRRIIEIIATFPDEHSAGAFEVAERRYVQAAQDLAVPTRLQHAGSLQSCEKLQTLIYSSGRKRASQPVADPNPLAISPKCNYHTRS